jgi:hypothetical protein
MDEYLSFVVQAAGTGEVDVAAAADRWRSAAAMIDALTPSEVGAADGSPIQAVPTELESHVAQYLKDPCVAAAYLGSPPTVGIIELDRVVVFQRAINLRYTEQLSQLIGEWQTSDVDLLKFCLAIDQPQPPINASQVSGNTFVFSSVSTDARLLSARLLDATQVTGHITSGRAHSAVVLQVGYGVNALNVVNVNGRLILNNGSHRAYALRAAGVTHAPAVIQTVTRPDELSIVPQVQQNPDMYLATPRPPMLKDYFNPILSQVVEAPRRLRQVRLQFVMEQFDAPG